MAKKFSELPAATALDGTEIVPLTQAGATVRTTVAALSPSTLAALNTKIADATLARTDATQTFTGAQRTGITVLSKTGSTIDVTPLANNSLERTMVAAELLGNPVSATRGMAWIVVIAQDATGSRALTFDTSYLGTGIAVDTSTDAANTERVFSCYALSATRILIVEANGAAV